RRPLSINEWLYWITYQITLDDVDVALCRDYPKDENCFAAAPIEPCFPIDTLSFRIPAEWRLQQILGRDPLLALGDCPP
ncbi:MAG TPA: hypothetical protein VKP30_21060, partial [Polyangiaceae bacterium]|nr:hypothetical protein [Polyangiaceae bacterium]